MSMGVLLSKDCRIRLFYMFISLLLYVCVCVDEYAIKSIMTVFLEKCTVL